MMARMFEALMRDEPATAWRNHRLRRGRRSRFFHCPAQNRGDHPVRTADDVEYAYSVLRNSCGAGGGGYYRWDGLQGRVGIVRRDDPTGCVRWESTYEEGIEG